MAAVPGPLLRRLTGCVPHLCHLCGDLLIHPSLHGRPQLRHHPPAPCCQGRIAAFLITPTFGDLHGGRCHGRCIQLGISRAERRIWTSEHADPGGRCVHLGIIDVHLLR